MGDKMEPWKQKLAWTGLLLGVGGHRWRVLVGAAFSDLFHHGEYTGHVPPISQPRIEPMDPVVSDP
jgi:hypothetical protein